METLRQLVQSAIGFDEARGDTVTIESLQFTLPAEQGTLAERAGSGFLDALRRPAGPARRARRHRAGADLLRAAADDRPPAGARARRADRPARDRRRARQLGAAADRRRQSSTCRRRPSPRSSGCATSSPAAARTAPRCCGAGSSPPTPARSPPDHERLSPGDLPARARRRAARRARTRVERRIEAAREAAYGEGYLAGQAAATDSFLEDQGAADERARRGDQRRPR